MPEILTLATGARQQCIEITDRVRRIVRRSGVQDGAVLVTALHATAAIVVSENADPNIGEDFLTALGLAVPRHRDWLHDRIDGNAQAHILAALLGPSESLPISGGDLLLGTWQGILLVELDGPRPERRIAVTVLPGREGVAGPLSGPGLAVEADPSGGADRSPPGRETSHNSAGRPSACRLERSIMLTPSRAVLAAVLIGLAARGASAAPPRWEVADGGNGHWYDVIDAGEGIDWYSAQAAAEAMGGHLATITSQAENDFVAEAASWSGYWYLDGSESAIGPWLGGRQTDFSSEPAGGWEWVTGEPWSYTNWYPAQPDDGDGAEQFLHLYGDTIPDSRWNDAESTLTTYGFVVEWELPPVGTDCRVVEIAAGWGHSLLRRDDGQVFAWGDNASGQIGAPGATGGGDAHLPVPLEGPVIASTGPALPAIAIAAGGDPGEAGKFGHSLAVLADGRVIAWGANGDGQLGAPLATGGADSPVPVFVEDEFTPSGQFEGARQVAAGARHSCALTGYGTVRCWGANDRGQLGEGLAQFRSRGRLTASPFEVQTVWGTLTGVKKISAGRDFTLALLHDGTVWAWGASDRGQLGAGFSSPDSWYAEQVLESVISPGLVANPLMRIRDVDAGADHALAARDDGTLVAWGADDSGQLGQGVPGPDQLVAVAVPGVAGADRVAAGSGTSYAIHSGGELAVWGNDASGALGSRCEGSTAVPKPVHGLAGVHQVSAHGNHALALGPDDSVWGFGEGLDGELGAASPPLSSCVPVTAALEGTAIAIDIQPRYQYCPSGCVLLVAEVAGGVEPLTFSWSPAGGISDPTILSPEFCPSGDTVLTLTVTDASGCSASRTTEVTLGEGAVAEPGANRTIAAGEVVRLGAPARPGVAYSWTPCRNLSNCAAAQPLASPWQTTTYTLETVVVGSGCLDVGQVTIDVCLGAPTFADVPLDDPFSSYIEAARAAGITSGCSAVPEYCPLATVTRRQMAAFLMRALGEPAPPAPAVACFSDVPVSDPFAPFVCALAARGITGGCGGGRFCPDEPVRRQQMAVFLLRGLGVTPPAGPASCFADVAPQSPFAPWVCELAARGVTGGCAPGRFCPDDSVTRGQMAVFLTRAFDLARSQPCARARRDGPGPGGSAPAGR